MDTILKIDADLEGLDYDHNLTLNDYLDKYLLKFSFESIIELLIPNLSRLNYYGSQNDRLVYKNILNGLTYSIANNRFKNEYIGQITLLTRENTILIINYAYLKKEQFGTKIIQNKDLYELLLIINNFEKKNKPDLKSFAPSLKTMTSEDAKDITASLIKENAFLNISQLRFPNIDRSTKLINQLLEKDEGKECNEYFKDKYGFDIKEYFRISWVTYIFLYKNYLKNDFSNIIDFDAVFKTLIVPNDPDEKFKNSFIKVFEKLSSISTPVSINDVVLYNTSYLWNNNVKKLRTNVYRIIDIGLFITSVFTNIFLTFEDPYLPSLKAKSIRSNPLRSEALGTCFEDYCNNLIEHFEHKENLNKYYKKEKNEQTPKEIADILFRIGDTLFFIECKAGYLSYQNLVNSDPKDLVNIILKKYGGEYIDENHYRTLHSSERKGPVQIMHNYYKINEILKNKDFSKLKDEEGLKKALSKIKKVYGIVLIEESYLSIPGLNNVLYLFNNKVVKEFKEKHFYPPIFVHVNDLYKIIYNEEIIKGTKLTFEKTIKDYLTTLHNNETPNKFYSYNDYLMNVWHAPIEFGEEENNNLIKNTLKEIFENVGLKMPNE